MVESLVLENHLVRMEFAPETLGLVRLLDKVSGIEHIHAGKDHRIWELVFRRGTQEQTLTNTGRPATRAAVETLPDGSYRATMTWEHLRHWNENDAVTVLVTVDLPQDDGVAEWRISVENNSDFWGLWEVRFPSVSHCLAPGEYDLAFAANNWGNLLRGLNAEHTTKFPYPSCEWALPFISLTRGAGSLYLGAHDPEVWTKTYAVKPGEYCYIGTYVENMAVPGSEYPGHYPVLFGVYQGDWLAACKRYRQWVVQQPWMQGGPLSRREDIPRSIKDTAIWVREIWAFDNPETDPHVLNEPLLDAQRYYAVPMGVHWYLWHHNLFDVDYPCYFPARPGFTERVKELVAAGMLVMPYINAVIADIDHPDYRRTLTHAAAVDQLGIPYVSIYGDASGRMAEMCFSAETWQDEVAGLVDRLTGECGVNAVYLDLLAAYPPRLCFDRRHGHPPGGGSWGARGMRELAAKARAIAVPRGAALTTESIADVHMGGIEGFLTWARPIGMEIPMMPAVYSGYALYIGSPVAEEYSEEDFVAAQARAFTWGCQNGWMAPDLHRKRGQESKAAYLKRIARYRYAAREFLTCGEMLTLLPPSATMSTVTVNWLDYDNNMQEVELPGVLGSLWRAEDGRLAMVMCNITDAPIEYPFQVDAVSHGLPATGAYRLTQLAPEGPSSRGTLPAGCITRTENLAPQEITVLVVEPDPVPRVTACR